MHCITDRGIANNAVMITKCHKQNDRTNDVLALISATTPHI